MGHLASKEESYTPRYFESPFATNFFVNSYISELQFLEKDAPTRHRTSEPQPATWLPSADGFVKLNTNISGEGDGSCCAAAVVCRDQGGKFLGASAIKFKFINATSTLKLLAIREGQALAEDLYVNQIHIAWDCRRWCGTLRKSRRRSTEL